MNASIISLLRRERNKKRRLLIGRRLSSDKRKYFVLFFYFNCGTICSQTQSMIPAESNSCAVIAMQASCSGKTMIRWPP